MAINSGDPSSYAGSAEVYDFLGIDPAEYVVFRTEGERYKQTKKKRRGGLKKPLPPWAWAVLGLGALWFFSGALD